MGRPLFSFHRLPKLLVLSTSFLVLANSKAAEGNETNQPSPSSKAPAVQIIEIKRLTSSAYSDLLPNKNAESFNFVNYSQVHTSKLKVVDGQTFTSMFPADKAIVVETALDEIDMPSQLLENSIRSAVCVPYSGLKSLHLRPLHFVRTSMPLQTVLSFYSGVHDRFMVQDNWFRCSDGLTDETIQVVERTAPVGTGESEFLRHFHIDGGISPKSYQRYCLNDKTIDGRAVKINVEISDHKLKRCSLPYIEQAFFD